MLSLSCRYSHAEKNNPTMNADMQPQNKDQNLSAVSSSIQTLCAGLAVQGFDYGVGVAANNYQGKLHVLLFPPRGAQSSSHVTHA
jgi:hypothetical protein